MIIFNFAKTAAGLAPDSSPNLQSLVELPSVCIRSRVSASIFKVK